MTRREQLDQLSTEALSDICAVGRQILDERESPKGGNVREMREHRAKIHVRAGELAETWYNGNRSDVIRAIDQVGTIHGSYTAAALAYELTLDLSDGDSATLFTMLLDAAEEEV